MSSSLDFGSLYRRQQARPSGPQIKDPVDARSKGRLETAKIPTFDRVDWNNTSVIKQYQEIIKMISDFTSPVLFAVLAPLYFFNPLLKANFFFQGYFS